MFYTLYYFSLSTPSHSDSGPPKQDLTYDSLPVHASREAMQLQHANKEAMQLQNSSRDASRDAMTQTDIPRKQSGKAETSSICSCGQYRSELVTKLCHGSMLGYCRYQTSQACTAATAINRGRKRIIKVGVWCLITLGNT